MPSWKADPRGELPIGSCEYRNGSFTGISPVSPEHLAKMDSQMHKVPEDVNDSMEDMLLSIFGAHEAGAFASMDSAAKVDSAEEDLMGQELLGTNWWDDNSPSNVSSTQACKTAEMGSACLDENHLAPGLPGVAARMASVATDMSVKVTMVSGSTSTSRPLTGRAPYKEMTAVAPPNRAETLLDDTPVACKMATDTGVPDPPGASTPGAQTFCRLHSSEK